MAIHEQQQAAYQLGAKLNDQPVDPRDRIRLANATVTKHETALALRHGRGNLAPDVEPSGGYNRIYSNASYYLGKSSAELAGAALAFGAGNCDQHALISSRLHGPRTAAGETVSRVGSKRMKHTWTELDAEQRPNACNWEKPDTEDGAPEPPVRRRDPEWPPTLVVDAWAAGPVARLNDTEWAQVSDAKQVQIFNKHGALSAYYEMLKHRMDFLPDGARWQESLAALKFGKEKPQIAAYRSYNQVIDPSFANNARDKLDAMSPLHQDLLAASAGREAYQLNIGMATARPLLDGILAQAENLDRQGVVQPVRPTHPLV